VLNYYFLVILVVMPLPTTGRGGIIFRSSVRLFVLVHPLTPILCDAISARIEGISMKLDTNIHHVSGHC